jgi:hypothetical protein
MTNATLTQELRDRKLPDCSPHIVYSDIEDKGSFWSDTKAGQFTNDYINSNTEHTMWAQNLFREIPRKPSGKGMIELAIMVWTACFGPRPSAKRIRITRRSLTTASTLGLEMSESKWRKEIWFCRNRALS